MTDSTTLEANVRWTIEVIPYDPDLIESPASAVKKLAKTSITSKNEAKSININHMVQGFSFGKSKDTIESTCQIRAHGMLDPRVICGNWVIIRSSYINGLGENTEYFQPTNGLIRFVGQIFDVQTLYTKGGSGALSRSHVIFVRSWTSIINMPIKYDFASIEGQLNKEPGTNIPGAIMALGQSTVAQFESFLLGEYTPYQAAKMAFTIITNMNKDWGNAEGVQQVSNEPIPKVALHMPKIPAGVLDAIYPQKKGFKSPQSIPFATLVAGRQGGAFRNKGDWRGILDAGEFKKFYGNYGEPPNIAMATGLTNLFTSGNAAIDLMKSVSDPDFNEVFADFIYEKSDNGTVIARPIIFVRDKPFTLDSSVKGVSWKELGYVEDIAGSKKIPWTYYSSVPRIKLNPASIVQANLGNTIINSANYIRLAWNGSKANSMISTIVTTFNGSYFKKELAQRFGTVSHQYTTSFLPPQSKNKAYLSSMPEEFAYGTTTDSTSNVDPKKWVASLASILKNWHTYNYRMASGSLVIKDENIPLTIGFNLSFSINGYELVGHIDSVSHQVAMMPTGSQSTITTVNVSRVMKVNDKGKLQLFQPHEIANLVQDPPEAVFEEPDTDLEVT